MKTFLFNLLSPLTEPFLVLKGALIFLIGPLNMQLAYLGLAVGIDLMFGIQVARKEKIFKWSTLFSKVRKKVFIYLTWIAMFHAFDMVAGLPDTARWAVIVMLAGMEVFSAIKNTAKLGHNRLAEALEQVYLTLVKTQTPSPPNNKQAVTKEPSQSEGGTVPDDKADKGS